MKTIAKIICILLLILFVVGCEEEVVEKTKSKSIANEKTSSNTNENSKEGSNAENKEAETFYEKDKIKIVIFTPAGEKTFEGLIISWKGEEITFLKDGSTLTSIRSSYYEVEKIK